MQLRRVGSPDAQRADRRDLGGRAVATATTIKQTKSERTREKLLAAAAKVVGKHGYAKASVTRITMEAGIASGGFYYYFDTRDEMFDELLPGLGKEMLAFIADRVGGFGWGLERETLGFQAYLEYLRVRPEFYRVFSEAYVYARRAYNKHMATVIEGYVKVLRRQKARGFITKGVADDDVPLLAHFLIGIRAYVSQFYMERDRKVAADVSAAVDLYRKMIAGRVFTEDGK
jgi:AcrR family transcriptional regulator